MIFWDLLNESGFKSNMFRSRRIFFCNFLIDATSILFSTGVRFFFDRCGVALRARWNRFWFTNGLPQRGFLSVHWQTSGYPGFSDIFLFSTGLDYRAFRYLLRKNPGLNSVRPGISFGSVPVWIAGRLDLAGVATQISPSLSSEISSS